MRGSHLFSSVRCSLIRWVRQQPVIFGIALLLLAFLVKPAFHAGDRLLFAAFPPSLTGHWAADERPLYEMSLSEKAGKVDGVGRLGPSAFTLRGIGTARGANLVMTFPSTRYAIPASVRIETRQTLRITLTGEDGSAHTRTLIRSDRGTEELELNRWLKEQEAKDRQP